MKEWLFKNINYIVLSLMAFALFFRVGFMPLSADEPIRALVALDMDLNGHFLAPELNGDSYLNKPPLYNWLLLMLFKLFGNYSEWIIRLPSLLPMLLFVPILFTVSNEHLNDKSLSWSIAFMFVTTGNLWFYSSYLGHIDILFSLLTFLQLYAIMRFSQKNRWLLCFAVSYALAAMGFLMKGLPSIAFQGITLLTCFITTKNFKRLFSWQHILGALAFILPIVLYIYAFSRQGNASRLLETLLTESTSRTVTDKSFAESFLHLLTFPFLFLVDLMPWGLLVFVFLYREVRQKIWNHSFYKLCLLVFGTNILLYWFSPDYRTRYVFMLIPFLLIPSIAGFKIILDKFKYYWFYIFGVICTAAIVGMSVYVHQKGIETDNLAMAISAALLIVGFLLLIWNPHQPKSRTGIVLTIVFMLAIRISYTGTIVPLRVNTGPYLQEMQEAKRMAQIVGDQDLFMYHSNVSLTMNWYLSAERKKMVVTKRNNFNINAFYLVPDDVLVDKNNVEVFDTFVRRYGAKPFSLVKFKSYFPKMPKKNDL